MSATAQSNQSTEATDKPAEIAQSEQENNQSAVPTEQLPETAGKQEKHENGITRQFSITLGQEKQPVIFYFKEAQRFIRQGAYRKAFLFLDKFYERNKKEEFPEEVMMKLARRYMAAGMKVLEQYDARDEIHTKTQSLIIVKKLSVMSLLWYKALVKILDKTRLAEIQKQQSQKQIKDDSENNENIISEEPPKISKFPFTKPQAKPSPFAADKKQPSQENKSQQLAGKSSTIIASFMVQQHLILPDISEELLSTNLILPNQLAEVSQDVNVQQNIISFWTNIIGLLNMWAAYYHKMKEASTSLKFLYKAEQFLSSSVFQETTNVQLLEVSWKTRMSQASILMELFLFDQAIGVYEQAFSLKQKQLELFISVKNELAGNATKPQIEKMQQSIERAVCKICVCLINTHIAYEQLEQAEKAMECLRLVYWLSVNFIKQAQYSDLLNESFKQYQLFSSNFDELLTMNGEINKIMILALARGDRFLPDRHKEGDDSVKESDDYLQFLDNYLYKKEDAGELNKALKILQRNKEQRDQSYRIPSAVVPPHTNESLDMSQNVQMSQRAAKSVGYFQRASRLNDSKETNYTDAGPSKGIADLRSDESLSTQFFTSSANGLGKRDFLNKTVNTTTFSTRSHPNLAEVQFTLNDESTDKTLTQASRLQTITSSFSRPQTAQLSQKSYGQLLKSHPVDDSSHPQLQQKEKLSLMKTMDAFGASFAKKDPQTAKLWDKMHLSKKQMKELQKQDQIEQLNKYQPKLVSSNKYFFNRLEEHQTDAVNLNTTKELEIDKVFGVTKRQKYSILDHDVDTFADNIIARQILTKSNCLSYQTLTSMTDQNINEASQEKNEFSFCRKVLQLKKSGKYTLNEKQQIVNESILRTATKKEANDILVTLTSKLEVAQKKTQMEESKRIQSLNLDIQPLIQIEKEEISNAKFKMIMATNSKALGLHEVKKNLKSLTSFSKTSKEKTPRQELEPKKSIKNVFFEEEEEQLDEQGKLKRAQAMNRETIKMQLTELDSQMARSHKEMARIQRGGHLRSEEDNFGDSDGQQDKLNRNNNNNRSFEGSIGEKIAKDYSSLSASTKNYIAKHQGQKINSFLDLVQSKMRLSILQNKQEDPKKPVRDPFRRLSQFRTSIIHH